MLENAVRICQARCGILFLYDDRGFEARALCNVSEALAAYLVRRGRQGTDPRLGLGRLATTRQPADAVAPTYRSSAWSHRFQDPVAQIEVVEESRGGMHAANPEDDLDESGVDFDDQLPQSMRLRNLWDDV